MFNVIRPDSLTKIIGQQRVKDSLQLMLPYNESVRLPSMLFVGPPGTGKTTFARAFSQDCGKELIVLNGAQISGIKYMLPVLASIKPHSFLFIDEIHRLPIRVEEFMYTVMEDGYYTVGKDVPVVIRLPQFNMIGATTNAGGLSKPLLDRFQVVFRLVDYSIEDIKQVVKNTADTLNINITEQATAIIANSARFTPRLAVNIVTILNAILHKYNTVLEAAQEAILIAGVDEQGLTAQDRLYLRTLRRINMPIGIKSLSHYLNIAETDIAYNIEPYLLKLGLIKITTRGRVLWNQI